MNWSELAPFSALPFWLCASLVMYPPWLLTPSGERNACHHYLQQMTGLVFLGKYVLHMYMWPVRSSSPDESVSACFCGPEAPSIIGGQYGARSSAHNRTILPSRRRSVPDGQSTLAAYAKMITIGLAAEDWRKAAGQLLRPCLRSSITNCRAKRTSW